MIAALSMPSSKNENYSVVVNSSLRCDAYVENGPTTLSESPYPEATRATVPAVHASLKRAPSDRSLGWASLARILVHVPLLEAL
jgi:hypothetical protein